MKIPFSKLFNKLLFLLMGTIVLSSCTKTESNVHFQGRVTYACTGDPVGFIQVTISVVYDNGIGHQDFVATTTTDANGYYSVIADVDYRGSFYYINVKPNNPISGSPYMYGNYAYENHNLSGNMITDCNIPVYNPFTFHVINSSPYTSNDRMELNAYNKKIKFLGNNVDTTFTLFFESSHITYYYTSYKQNIFNSGNLDQSSAGCFDTSFVAINY